MNNQPDIADLGRRSLGLDRLRHRQQEAVDAAVAGNDVLAGRPRCRPPGRRPAEKPCDGASSSLRP